MMALCKRNSVYLVTLCEASLRNKAIMESTSKLATGLSIIYTSEFALSANRKVCGYRKDCGRLLPFV